MHKQDEKELNGGRLCAWQDYHTAFGKLIRLWDFWVRTVAVRIFLC